MGSSMAAERGASAFPTFSLSSSVLLRTYKPLHTQPASHTSVYPHSAMASEEQPSTDLHTLTRCVPAQPLSICDPNS